MPKFMQWLQGCDFELLNGRWWLEDVCGLVVQVSGSLDCVGE